MRREVSRGNAAGDQCDGRFAHFGLKLVMEFPHGAIPLCSLYESRKTRRERRIGKDIGDMTKNALEFLSWRAGDKLRVSLLLKQFERVGDQSDLIWPMTVDRRFADASATSGGFYGECAIPHFTQLIEHCL